VPVKVAVKLSDCSSATVAFAGAMATAGGGVLDVVTVIVAVALFVPSATLVAVSVTCGGCGGVAGAVYKPAVDTLPHALPVHPAPARLHITAVAGWPVLAIVAVNCCVPPAATEALGGAACTRTSLVTVTDALPPVAVFASLVACTCTLLGEGITAGA